MILVGKGTVITRDETKPLIKDGGVVLDGERIVKVGDYETLRSEYPQAELIDAKGQIIMPSLINMHEHIYSAFARGLSINGYNPNGFLDILDGMWWTIDRNLTLGELNHARSPLGWLVWLVLTILLDVSYKRGKPDLNILFQYNMPLRALAKMTNGAVSMGMVDGIVMEAQGFWIIGLLRVAYEAIKNVILNAQLEKRLHQG